MSSNSEPSIDFQTAGLSCRNKSGRLYRLQRHGVLYCQSLDGGHEDSQIATSQLSVRRSISCASFTVNSPCRIIRIGLRREITVQSDVTDIGIRKNACSDILYTGCRNPRVEIPSITFPPDEILWNAFVIPFA